MKSKPYLLERTIAISLGFGVLRALWVMVRPDHVVLNGFLEGVVFFGVATLAGALSVFLMVGITLLLWRAD